MTCSAIKCSGDAYVAMDVQSYKSDRVRNVDIQDMVGVAPIEEKLVQHLLRWFGHIQRRPLDVLVCSGVLKRVENVKRGRGRSNLI